MRQPLVDALNEAESSPGDGHADLHSVGGSDEVRIEDLGTDISDASLVYGPDGGGGVEAKTPVHPDIEDLGTSEVDPSKRYAPDGAGGVEAVDVSTMESITTASVDTSLVFIPNGSGGVEATDIGVGDLLEVVFPLNVQTWTTIADLPPADMNGVRHIGTDVVVKVNGTIDVGTDRFTGTNIVIMGDPSTRTVLITNTALPMFSNIGDSFYSFQRVTLINSGGPWFDFDLGLTSLSVLAVFQVFFIGNATLGGSGSIGTITSADRAFIENSFCQDLDDGLLIDGQVNEFALVETSVTFEEPTSTGTGLAVSASSIIDIFEVTSTRFKTTAAAQSGLNLSSTATYQNSARVTLTSRRGPGTLLDPAGLQKTDPDLLAINNIGVVSSAFVGTASFTQNTVQTVISVPGTFVRIGNGNASHLLFNGSAFVERFTISGAQTQLQEFTYNGRLTRLFDIRLDVEMTRDGGGSVSVGLGIQVQGVLVPDSVKRTEVANTATYGFSKTTVELAPGNTVQLVVANYSSTANLTIIDATWSVKAV